MSQTCTALGLGLAFVAALLLNMGNEALSLPLWQKAAYFLSAGIGMVMVLRFRSAKSKQSAHATARKQPGPAER